MENSKAMEFIGQIKEYYPRWQASQTEIDEWLRRLKQFDFDRAIHALDDFVFNTRTRTIEPPAGRIMGILRERAFIKIDTRTEPIKVFTLTQVENNKRKQPFFVGSEKELKKRPAQSYEQEAEIKRKKFESLYGGTWIVTRDWEMYF